MAAIVGVAGGGLNFYPLYHIHHDQWTVTSPINFHTYYHHGHTHLFMLGYRFDLQSQDAFFGRQTFQFNLKDLWGPRSDDLNQSTSYRIIGTPKWYWHVQEVWRRMYIQQWDEKIVKPDGKVVGRKGIKWDASAPDKTHGPFREGRNFSPLFIEGNRTLPVEYYKTEDKLQLERDNYVMDKAEEMINEFNAWAKYPPDYPVVELRGQQRFSRTFNPLQWNLDHPGGIYPGEPAAHPSWPDALYIYPIMEYQTVTQLNWERMPGAAAAHDRSDTQFGDGYANTVTIPFTNPQTGHYNSPFGPTPGVVLAPGNYCGTNGSGQPLVPVSKRLKFRKREGKESLIEGDGNYDFINEPFGLPAFDPNDPEWEYPVTNDPRTDLSEKQLTFQNPYPAQADGRWVQQCIGGIVQVRCEVTIEHKLNQRGKDGYQTVWVQGTQYMPQTAFAGSDQSAPP